MRATVFGRLSARGTPVGLRVCQLISAFVLFYAAQCFLSTISFVVDYAAARNWIQASASLSDVSIDKPVDADESPRWLTLRYQYSYLDQSYEGNRLTLADSPLYLKPLLEATAKELTEALEQKTPVTCYIDPDHPSSSVLNRSFLVTVVSIRLGIFAIATAIGVLLLMVPTAELNRRERIESMQKLLPNEPWRWRTDWSAGKIRSLSHVDSLILISVAAIYLFMLLPLGLLVIREHGREVFSFPGITLLVGGWGAFNLARKRIWPQRCYDRSVFQIGAPTGIVGGPLYGSISIPAKMPLDTPLRLSIECVELEHTNTSHDDSEINERVLWRDSKLLQETLRTSDPGSTLVPVYFAIPHTCQSSKPNDNPSILWLLKIGPDGREGLAEYAAFEVPVFETSESSPDFVADPEVMKEFEVPVTLQDVLNRSGCRINREAGETIIRFSLFRPSIVFQSLALIAVLGAITAGLILFGYTIWASLPAVFAAIVILASGQMLLWRSEVRAGDDSITAIAGIWGFRKRLSVTRDIVVSLETAVEFAMKERSAYLVNLAAQIPIEIEETGADREQIDNLEEHHSDGLDDEPEVDYVLEQLTIARRLSSQHEATMLAQWLAEQLQLTDAKLDPLPHDSAVDVRR